MKFHLLPKSQKLYIPLSWQMTKTLVLMWSTWVTPHAVTIVPDVLTADVAGIGPQVESHKRFPERVNAGFMQVIDDKHVRLRVFERGVGETLACGTGACAAAVSGMRRGLLANSVEVELAGGKLQIEWQEGDVVWMTGPTTHVYDGRLDLRYFQG